MDFAGFEIPRENWSKLPNALIANLPLITSLGEMKVILYILRHTWGYQEFEQAKKITLDEFQHGRKKRDGTRLDQGTGMSKPSIIEGLKRAEQHGFITVEEDAQDLGRVKRFYSLAIDDERNVTPGVKKLYPSSQETLPRSEKETLERKKERLVSPLDGQEPSGEEPAKEEPITSITEPGEMMAECARRRAGKGSMTVADGDEAAELFQCVAFRSMCRLVKIDPSLVSRKQEIGWTRELRSTWERWKVTPDELARAIDAIPKSEFAWRTFTSPYEDSFKDTAGLLALRLKGGGPVNANGEGRGNGHGNTDHIEIWN